MSIDDDEPKVKQLLDAATQADLARWFSLPSFQQLEEEPRPAAPVIDEEMQAVIERRDRAIANVDPGLLESIRARTQEKPETLIKFEATLDVHVDPQFGLVDEELVERTLAIAEPREVEIPEELRDDMKECTPQALLRDLHRPELEFDKAFEVVDHAAEQRLDIVAEVASAMSTSWKLPPLGPSPAVEGSAILDALRAERRRPWTELLPALRGRRVRE